MCSPSWPKNPPFEDFSNSANLPSCVVILDVWSWNILNMSAMASIDIRAISCVENVGTKVFKLSDWAAAGSPGCTQKHRKTIWEPISCFFLSKYRKHVQDIRIRIMKRNIPEFACNPTTMKSGNQLNKLPNILSKKHPVISYHEWDDWFLFLCMVRT